MARLPYPPALPAAREPLPGGAGRLLRRLRPLAAWAAVGGLLVLAWNLKHPLMYWLRIWETPILLFAGLTGGGLALAGPPVAPRRPLGRFILGTALLAAAGCTIHRELAFLRDKAAVLAGGGEMESLGRHFIVGFTRFDEVETLAEQGLIGGIYLTRRNLRGQSPAEVAQSISRLQARRAAAGRPPLIVAADQEGGPVSHLSPHLEALPPLASLVDAASPLPLAERARRYGRRQGQGLAALGVNLNFGPVVDLKPARPASADDRLTRIASRAIAADPGVVAEVAAGYVAGLADAGVGATLKHFPGLGQVRADTHLRSASLAADPADLAGDWLPFRRVGPAGGAAMMLGHVVLPALDPEHAASHSRAVVHGLLRRQWRYDGLLVTDDLNMGAVYGLGIGRIASEALAAGVDLVLVSYDPEQYYRALAGAARALAAGTIAPADLAASDRRLTAFHQRLYAPPPGGCGEAPGR